MVRLEFPINLSPTQREKNGIQAQCASLFIISVLNHTQHCKICVVLFDISFSLKQRERTDELLARKTPFLHAPGIEMQFFSQSVLYQVFTEIWHRIPMLKIGPDIST